MVFHIRCYLCSVDFSICCRQSQHLFSGGSSVDIKKSAVISHRITGSSNQMHSGILQYLAPFTAGDCRIRQIDHGEIRLLADSFFSRKNCRIYRSALRCDNSSAANELFAQNVAAQTMHQVQRLQLYRATGRGSGLLRRRQNTNTFRHKWLYEKCKTHTGKITGVQLYRIRR